LGSQHTSDQLEAAVAKRALLVGIDYYLSMPDLSACVDDATALCNLLARNEDGSPNYECRLLVNPGGPLITQEVLRAEWQRLFAGFPGDLLFYFAGHGTPTEVGGAIVTHEGTPAEPGLPMNELIHLANESAAQEVLIILDCCHSGAIGAMGRRRGGKALEQHARLREGVTILAATRSGEASVEAGTRGVFTSLLLAALQGGAADVRGHVSAAAVYAYIEQALGAWDQRPLYKSYASHLAPVRCCLPHVSDELLRRLPQYFAMEDSPFQLAPSYEFSHPDARPEHVAIFTAFKSYRDARLLRSVEGDDLYFAALYGHAVALTPVGRLYWRLAKQGRI
jgi:Caspase domain